MEQQVVGAVAVSATVSGVEPLDRVCVVGLVRRARRIADLSQRDLARVLGVSQSVVARWETGRTQPSLAHFRRLLRLAGLTMRVDLAEEPDAPAAELPALAEDSPVPATEPTVVAERAKDAPPQDTRPDAAVEPIRTATPMRDGTVRDRAGRRYPAHLDVLPERSRCARWERPESDVVCYHRGERDRNRARTGYIPGDHPTRTEVLAVYARRRDERMAAARQRWQWFHPRPQILPECTCLDECFETVCVDTCPCGCERYAWPGDWAA